MRSTVALRVLSALKKHQPANVRARLQDGEVNDVAVSKSRQRWQKVMDTLGGLAWVAVELYDHKGQLVGPPLQNDDLDQPAAGLEDVGNGAPIGAQAARELHLMRMLLTFGDQLMGRFVEAFRPAMDAQRLIVSDLSARLASAEQFASQRERTATQLLGQLEAMATKANLAAAAKEGGGELQEMLAAVPLILQALSALGIVPQPQRQLAPPPMTRSAPPAATPPPPRSPPQPAPPAPKVPPPPPPANGNGSKPAPAR